MDEPEIKYKVIKQGPLELIFVSASAKILDFLAIMHDNDYCKQDIAKYSGLSVKHTLREMAKLEEYGLIKKTRNVGSSRMYKFNMDDPAAQLLDKFLTTIADKRALKIVAEEEAKQKQ